MFQTTLAAKMTITEVFPTNATTSAAENKTSNSVLDLLGLQQQQGGNKNETNETVTASTLQPTIRGGMTAAVR